MKRKSRNILVALVVVLVLAVLFVWLWGGRARAPYVVELTVVTTDELEAAVNYEGNVALSNEFLLGPGDSGPIRLGPEALAAIRAGKGDSTFQIKDGIRELSEIGVIVIERMKYGGEGRDGVIKRVVISKRLEALARQTPEEVVLGLDDPMTKLYDVIPWPKKLSWRITRDGKLQAESDGAQLMLAPGEAGKLASAAAEIHVKLTTYGVMSADDASELPPVVEHDLGKVRFTSEISVRFLGRVPMEEHSK